MQFIFTNKSSCCGKGPSQLTSAKYAIDAANAYNSVLQALDRFYTNYRIDPAGVILSADELAILQANLPSSEFSLVHNVLHLRAYPITVI